MDPNSPISVWRFKSVLFGASKSPFMLNCTVADILRSNEFPFQLEIFVDNLFILENNDQNLIPAADRLIKIFEKASMPLHEVASNCDFVNTYFKDKGILTNNSKLKILGMDWGLIKVNSRDFCLGNIIALM